MMVLSKVIWKLLCIVVVDSYVLNYGAHINDDNVYLSEETSNRSDHHALEIDKAHQISEEENADSVFNGVYRECFLYLSYSCIQKKTLLYLQKLNDMSEVSIIGDVLKFGKYRTL